jgi:hypothetical protein
LLLLRILLLQLRLSLARLRLLLALPLLPVLLQPPLGLL